MPNKFPKVDVISTSCCTPQRNLSCNTDNVGICGRDANGTARNIRTDHSGHLDVTATDLDIRNLSCTKDSVGICGQGVDNQKHFMQTDMHGSICTIPNVSAYSQIGRLFSFASTIYDKKSLVLFENPAENNKIMYLDKIISGLNVLPPDQPISYVGLITCEIIGDIGPYTAGFQVPTSNLNLGSTNISTIITRIIPDYDSDFGDTLFWTEQLNGMMTLDFQSKIIIPPGHNLLVQQSAFYFGDTEAYSKFTITYYELDM